FFLLYIPQPTSTLFPYTTLFRSKNKVISSLVKSLPDQHEFMCFVAMVETLNNRLNDDMISLDNIGLVVIDEAHYNSFRKLFTFRSEEHTSELQSREKLVCRLLLE